MKDSGALDPIRLQLAETDEEEQSIRNEMKQLRKELKNLQRFDEIRAMMTADCFSMKAVPEEWAKIWKHPGTTQWLQSIHPKGFVAPKFATGANGLSSVISTP